MSRPLAKRRAALDRGVRNALLDYTTHLAGYAEELRKDGEPAGARHYVQEVRRVNRLLAELAALGRRGGQD